MQKIYNFKNRVEISISKEKLKKMAKDLQIPIKELDGLIQKILTSTFNSTIQELDEWIDKNIPLLPKSENYILKEDLPSEDVNTFPPHQVTSNELKLIDEIIVALEVKVVENSKPIISKNILREHMKMGLKSCSIKDGRFYRIRFGFQLIPELFRPLNEDKSLASFHFIERMIDFSYNRTLYHLDANYKKYSPNNQIHAYLKKTMKVICKRD